MSKRSAGHYDRHRNGGRGAPFATGSLGHTHKAVVAPPPLAEGQVRCPVCRNGVKPTLKGHLRRHLDLFGHQCWNRARGDTEPGTEPAPAVTLAAAKRLDGGLLSPTGFCHGEGCGRPVSGERKFCGRCLANRL